MSCDSKATDMLFRSESMLHVDNYSSITVNAYATCGD